MKIAVIGTGKTGTEVVKLVPKDDVVGPFNRSHPPTLENLQKADVCILFTPSGATDELITLLLKAKKPAVWGTTGYDWPKNLDATLKSHQIAWIYGENFSLGMVVMCQILKTLRQESHRLDSPVYEIHDLHHAQKKDAPSGSAKMWQRELGLPVNISSTRDGDHPGTHTLTIETPHETISLEHKAKRRSQYAQGALWAAEQLVEGNMPAGWHNFKTLIKERK